eukprot:6648896-Alexandrium_andersonii.AAC.1
MNIPLTKKPPAPPEKSHLPVMRDAPWQCSQCGTWHRNPMCVNCRACGHERYDAKEKVQRRPTVKVGGKMKPWVRRANARIER